MAVGPDGRAIDTPAGADEAGGMLRGLEAAIDRAASARLPGQPLVFGIHQELDSELANRLEARYRAAGWPRVSVRRTETGAHLVVLDSGL